MTMKTQYYTATSLDGFIADANHSLDWLLKLGSEPPGDYNGVIAAIGAIAMGSSTYEWLLRHHVYPDEREPRDWPYSIPTWVFTTRTLRTIPDANIRFARGNVSEAHQQMRAAAGEKNIWIVGGGDLAGQFHDHRLLDEIIVDITSVTLGSGAPLLPRAITNPSLRLTSAEMFNSHFARLAYDVVYTDAIGDSGE